MLYFNFKDDRRDRLVHPAQTHRIFHVCIPHRPLPRPPPAHPARVYLSIYLSLPIHQSIHPSIHLPKRFYLSIHPSIYINTTLAHIARIYLSLSIYPSTYIFIFVYPSIHPSIHLYQSIYLSIYLSMYLSQHSSRAPRAHLGEVDASGAVLVDAREELLDLRLLLLWPDAGMVKKRVQNWPIKKW